MNRVPATLAALLILVTNAYPGTAPEWITQLSHAHPGDFSTAQHPVLSEFVFGWAFLHAGNGTARITKTSPGRIQIEAEAQTSGPVRSLFRIDALFRASASATSLRPVEVEQLETYHDESLKTSLQFDAGGVIRRRVAVAEPKPGTGKPKRFAFSPLFEPFTAYLWLRSQPNKPGDEHRLVLYAGADPYLLHARVQGTDPIPVGTLTTRALRMDLKFFAIDRELHTAPYRKCRKATIWISDSPSRQLLRAEAELFIGKIWLQLQGPIQSPK